MVDNDLYLRMITELENKKAYEQVDDLSVYIQKNLGKAIDKTNLKFSKLGKDGNTSIYYKLLKQGNSFLKMPLEIENSSGKLLKQAGAVSFASKKDLQYFSGIDIPSVSIPNNKVANKKQKEQLSAWGKILNRFKSYGLLRIVRTIFMAIEKGLSQGIEKLTAFDKQANKTMSTLGSSADKVFGGIALAVMPVIEAITPILTTLSNVIADIGNSISRASAESKGLTEYSKINLDYMKQSANEANKLLTAFDKFQTLNAKESPFIKGNVQEDKDVGLLAETKIALLDISAILATISAYKIISWIVGGDAGKFFKKIKEDLPIIKSKIVDISSAVSFVFAIHNVVQEIINLIDNWDSMSLAKKIKSICKIALYGIGSILIAVGSLLTALSNPAGVVLKIAGISAIGATGILDAVGVFGNGGVAEKGSLFYANEKGPELVYSGKNNSASIMNIEQFEEASSRALFNWWAIARYDIPSGDVVLDIDGAQIARSKRFKSELNRTNSGLNLR